MTEIQRGNRFLVAGRYEEAIASYLAHAANCPEDAPRCLKKAGDAARRSNVLRGPVDVASGVLLISASERSRAESFYRRAVVLSPDYFPAVAALALMLPVSHPERIALLERAAALRDDILVLDAIGKHYLSLDPGRALEYYRRAQCHAPLDQSGYDGLVASYEALGKREEAQHWRERWRDAYVRKRRIDGRRGA